MKKFTLYWLTGDKEVIEGDNIVNAMNSAGIGAGAIAALDFWAKGNDDSYTWNKVSKKWEKK